MAEMEKHKAFTEWALKQGVKLHGVAANRFPGRGLGIVATEAAPRNKLLISVPTSALRTRPSVPQSISSLLHGITTHGLLAADLALDLKDPLSPRAPWHAVLPSYQDFKDSLPLLWSPVLQDLLPPAAATLLANQKTKFEKDWTQVSAAFQKITREDYEYTWCLVNTRTFYYTPPLKSKTRKVVDPNENMALNPFADYFNHSSLGCSVEFSSQGFEISVSGDSTPDGYDVGDEVYISYGKHGNDFLLAEYGFIMDHNLWDDVSLEELVLGEMMEEQRELVKENGFYKKYVLDREGACYRTQVALRAMVVPERRWLRFIAGSDDGEADQQKVDELLKKLLGTLKADSLEKVEMLEGLKKEGKEDSGQIDCLIKRWKQIVKMVINVCGPSVVIEQNRSGKE